MSRQASYLDSELLRLKKAASRIEREWLASIGAPVNRLPKRVAQAVSTRILLSSLQPELARWYMEQIISEHILRKALDD